MAKNIELWKLRRMCTYLPLLHFLGSTCANSLPQVCLIRLLGTEDGQALDMNAALTQISIFFRMSSEITKGADEQSQKMHLMISFCVRNATHGQGNRYSDLCPNSESRMGKCLCS